MCDVTFVPCRMIRVDCNQFDKHFRFFNYVFVFKNKPKWSFLHYAQVLKIKCVIENLFHTSIETDRGKVNNCRQQRKLGGLHIFHFTFIDTQKIINEYFWNFPSKQMNSFDYLCLTFFMESKIIGKNKKFLCQLCK